ncbi:hypothetical protein L208DRAFT_1254022, partial [Tricholoma matsutake]
WAQCTISLTSTLLVVSILSDAWFIWRFCSANITTFKALAVDIYDSYILFSITSRVPAFCVLTSFLSLLFWYMLQAFEAWQPVVITIMCVGFLLVTLQYWVDGAHQIAQITMEYTSAGFHRILNIGVNYPS